MTENDHVATYKKFVEQKKCWEKIGDKKTAKNFHSQELRKPKINIKSGKINLKRNISKE